MKKIILGALILATVNSCSDDYYDSLNHDPMNPEVVPASFLVSNATDSYLRRMLVTNVNTNVFRLYAQYWNETQYVQESNYELDERNINGSFVNELMMNVIYDSENAKQLIAEDIFVSDMEKANQTAICDLIQIQAWQTLVDTFGDIPYSEALQALDGVIKPKYDDDALIYQDLINRTIAAINSIDTSGEGYGANDIMYAGDMTKWKKFGASLLLKLGVQVSDANTSLAQTTINSAVAFGVFSDDSDSFRLHYPGVQPFVNPLWTDLVLSGRKDFVAANTIVDYMNELNDPRRTKYFRENLGTGIFLGGVYGNATPYNAHTQVADVLHDIDYPGNLLDYSEVLFLLSESAARGFSVGGTAESYYNDAITASMTFWGNTPEEISAYLTQSSVAWESAPGDWKQKIGMQYWLAMYNKGFDGWTVYRRLDAPSLNLPAFSGSPVPKRFTYPLAEQTINSENYNAAATAMGGDTQQTRIFWDVN